MSHWVLALYCSAVLQQPDSTVLTVCNLNFTACPLQLTYPLYKE